MPTSLQSRTWLPEMDPRREAKPPRSKLSIGFILTPNFTLLAFSGFVDTLRLAADEADGSRQIGCTWSILGPDGSAIRASCGVRISPTSDLVDPRHFDYIAVVGGVMDGRDLHGRLKDYLREADRLAVPLIAVCTGSFVLARLDLLTGRKCCVSWFHAVEFGHRYPELQSTCEEQFIIDGDRISCAGGSSVIHLAAHLVKKHCSPTLAKKALRILIEGEHRSPVTPQPQPLGGANAHDFRVRKAMLLMERTLSEPVSTDFIAKHVGMSRRQLERLFRMQLNVTPAEFQRNLRLKSAFELLERCNESISKIALHCGFANRSHFAASFREKFGHSPSTVRSRAQTQPPPIH